MDKKEIRKILTNPSKDLIILALNTVNLTDKERQIIEYTEMRGITEERTAEILDISDRNVRYIKEKAFEKLNKAWSYNILVSLILKEEM